MSQTERPEATPAPADERWCERLASQAAEKAGLDGAMLTPRLQASLLHLARDVAHGSERKNAPLATFVAGRYVQARVDAGVDAETALAEIAEVAAGLLAGDGGGTPLDDRS